VGKFYRILALSVKIAASICGLLQKRFRGKFVPPPRPIGRIFSGMDNSHLPSQPDRRDFLTKAASIVIGGSLAIAPAVAGLGVLCDPLRRKSEVGASIRVASLNAVPEGGEPVAFPAIITLVDAWNTTPNVPVGSVYLQRLKGGSVRALNASCPHAGCSVKYRPTDKDYFCPCHNSQFKLDGQILDLKSPSPRALDELPVEIRNGTEIWVTFQRFRAGTHEKIPV
jgi:nitrite reductase/ring-hydroxylating ferredoxin subunit